MGVTVYRITEDDFDRYIEDGVTRRIIEYFPTPGIVSGVGDISKTWKPALTYADYTLIGQSLATGTDLETALLNSLFSDRTAHADDEIPDGTTDRRGWWGDENLGSRLWLLERSTLSKQTTLKAKDYIKEATQWMLDDGVATSIVIDCQAILPSMLLSLITISRAQGQKIAPAFAWVWDQIGN